MNLRQEIITATIEEFNEKGLKFTMEQLAKRLGISKKTLYVEFNDKESLFVESVERCFNEIKESERKIFENETLDIIEKIRKIIIVLPEQYKAMDFRKLYGLQETYPHIYKKIEDKIEGDWDRTIQLLEQAMREGRIKKVNLVVLKTIISSTIEAYISTNILTDNNIEYINGLEEMINIIMDGIII